VRILIWLGDPLGRQTIEYQGCPGIKRPEREFDYSVSSVADVKNEWSLFLLTQYAFISSTASYTPFLLLLNFGNWFNVL